MSSTRGGRCASEPSVHGPADPRQILHDHPAGADVQVAHLGISHLSIGQANVETGGAQLRRGRGGDEAIIVRDAGLPDRVVGGVVAQTPTVEYDQHHGTGNGLRHIGDP